MSSTDVQNVRDWRDVTRDATRFEQNYDPVTMVATNAEDENLDWLDKRVNNDPPPPAGTGVAKPSREEAVQFETRGQDLSAQASAAGAKRSDNDSDLLGYTYTGLGARRRAARNILIGD